jgi:myo-inositol catabolism protein IolC
MVSSLKEIQAAGVEPSIWKLEGVDKPESALAVVKQAQSNGRKVGCYNFGTRRIQRKSAGMAKSRSKNPWHHRICRWKNHFLATTCRTLKQAKYNRKEAVEKVAQNYIEFTELWLNEAKRRKK